MNQLSAIGRHARILQILAHLQTGGGLNGRDLARKMNVSRRTIYRDLNMIRDAGIHVFFDEPANCYRLTPQHDLAVAPTFTPDELTILIAAVHFSVLKGMPHFSAQLRQATSKLLSESPLAVRHSISRLVHACTMRAPLACESAAGTECLQQVFQSVRQRRVLQVTLHPRTGQTFKTFLSPYQVVADSNAWQVIGRSTHHQAITSLDPALFVDAHVTDNIYAIPRGFSSRD